MCEVKVSLLLKEGVVGATKCGYWLDVEEEVSVNTRNLGSVWLERVPNCSIFRECTVQPLAGEVGYM